MPIPSFQELIVIFMIVLVLFGATRLPQLGRGLGEGIRNFKKGLREAEGDDAPLPEATDKKKPT